MMLRRLNLRLIFLFFLALWLFEKGGQILGYLTNMSLAEEVRHSRGNISMLRGGRMTAGNLIDFMIASEVTGIVAALIGLAICLVLCRHKKWNWTNAFLAFVILCLVEWLPNFSTQFLVLLFRSPGDIFTGVWYYLFNAFIAFAIGSIVILLASTIRRQNNTLQPSTNPQQV